MSTGVEVGSRGSDTGEQFDSGTEYEFLEAYRAHEQGNVARHALTEAMGCGVGCIRFAEETGIAARERDDIVAAAQIAMGRSAAAIWSSPTSPLCLPPVTTAPLFMNAWSGFANHPAT